MSTSTGHEALIRTRWHFERKNLFSTTRVEFYRACSQAQGIGFRLLLYNRWLRLYSSGAVTIRMGEQIAWFAGESELCLEREALISLLASHQDNIDIKYFYHNGLRGCLADEMGLSFDNSGISTTFLIDRSWTQ